TGSSQLFVVLEAADILVMMAWMKSRCLRRSSGSIDMCLLLTPSAGGRRRGALPMRRPSDLQSSSSLEARFDQRHRQTNAVQDERADGTPSVSRPPHLIGSRSVPLV